MKLIRFREDGRVKPGVLFNGEYLDVSGHTRDYDKSFFSEDGIAKLSSLLSSQGGSLPRVSKETVLDCPVAQPSKLICIGLNYAKHAKETGAQVPKEPVIFFKATTSIVGPSDHVVIPKNSIKTDWEVELAVVIGKRASYVEEKDAMDYVAGYVLHNDVSERAFQLERGGNWTKGKSCDTFAPLGPWLATKDEIKDPHQLRLWLKLNGEMVQDSNTSDFIFGIPHLISYTSQFMTLLPGDIISTGTPSGVGMGRTPQRYLREGDVMELGIDGLGESRQEVISYETFLKNK